MKKTNEISIVDNKRVGILKVKYDGIAVAQFFYCTEWDERDFMTRDAAKKLATKIARYIVSRGTIHTTKGVALTQIYFNINE